MPRRKQRKHAAAKRRKSSPPMSLAEFQERFWKLARYEASAPRRDAGRLLSDRPPLSPGQRADLYAEMYWERHVGTLRDQFPKLCALVGPDAFDVLATRYVEAHPSTHHSLARLGEALPRHLSTHPSRRPDLADLAALEWARYDVQFERDDAPASLSVLSAAPQRSLEHVRLRAVASARLLALDHDALALWQALADGRAAPPPAPASVAAVVWRAGGDAVHAKVRPRELEPLRRLFAGAPFGEISAGFGEARDALDVAEAAVLRWFDAGWVATV
jgi:hypothetical protein